MNRRRSIAPSKVGQAEAERQVDAFARELVEESARIASRLGADSASADHVAQAAAHLYTSGASRTSQQLGTLGGIIFGAASGALISVVLEPNVNALAVGVSSVFLCVGAGMTTAGLVRRG